MTLAARHKRCHLFGLIETMSRLLVPYQVCGTPDYFAPELAEIASSLQAIASFDDDPLLADGDRKGYGPPLDCWAVGCIIYELLAGRPPYQAQDEAVLYYKITENQMEFQQEVKDLLRLPVNVH